MGGHRSAPRGRRRATPAAAPAAATPARRRRAARRRAARRSRIALFAAIAVLGTGGALLATRSGGDEQPNTRSAAAGSAERPTPAEGRPGSGRPSAKAPREQEPPSRAKRSTAPPEPAARHVDARLEQAVAGIIAGSPGHSAVAATDLDSGATATYNGARQFNTASISKVAILAALLLKSQNENENAGLTDAQRATAAKMIRESDNKATDKLYEEIGWHHGLDAATHQFGMKHTTAGVDKHFGLTSTDAADQLRLLHEVFGRSRVLDTDSTDYLKSLMGSVIPSQRWGVSAAADPGSTPMLKNGWLPRTKTGRWNVNSIGMVTHRGHRIIVVVLGDDQPNMKAGMALAARLAAAAAPAVRGG